MTRRQTRNNTATAANGVQHVQINLHFQPPLKYRLFNYFYKIGLSYVFLILGCFIFPPFVLSLIVIHIIR